MQAIILAAGKGTRLGALTQDIPKPMMLFHGKPLLAHIIERMPDAIDEVLIAVGYRSETIKTYFADTYAGKLIRYVDASELNGTAGALFKARGILKGRFLVLYADDIYAKEDIERLLQYPYAMGVFEGSPNHSGYLQVDLDAYGNIKGFRKPTDHELREGMRIVVGAFVLDESIFDCDMVPIKNGEYGLPQTILLFAEEHAVKAVPMQSWGTITYERDLDAMDPHIIKTAS